MVLTAETDNGGLLREWALLRVTTRYVRAQRPKDAGVLESDDFLLRQ